MLSQRKVLLLISLTALVLLCAAQAPRQVRIIIDNANIRAAPEISAEILAVASKGALYEVVERSGPWYTIKMGVDKTGQVVYGYIHQSVAEPCGETRPTSQDRIEPPPAPQPQPVPPPPSPVVERLSAAHQAMEVAPAKVLTRDRLLSGSFLKGGFNDHWVASFGYDFGIGRYVGIGLEFQSYFKNLSQVTSAVIQLDIFANLKLGFRLWLFTFFGGGGIGPDLSYTSAEIEDQASSQFKTQLAYHGIAGVAVNLGKIAIVFECQPTWISKTDVSRDTRDLFFFIGLRF